MAAGFRKIMEIILPALTTGLHQAASKSRHSLPALMATALAVIACFWIAHPADAAESEILPPFNLRWNQSPVELEEQLLATSAKIVERKKAATGEDWQVEGLEGIALSRCVFELRGGGLAGVELQYRKDDWSPATYEEFMRSTRRRIESKRGPGQELTRQQQTERGIMKTLLGYRWESTGGSIELIYFAAENEKDIFRLISLHYRCAPPSPPATPQGKGAAH